MSAPRPDIADLLEVDVPPDGKVITASDLHLPPVRTDVSGRSCEMLARHLADCAGSPVPLTVVLAGDVIELLGCLLLKSFCRTDRGFPPPPPRTARRPGAS